jgi:probable HAF family extracellular repeat protein
MIRLNNGCMALGALMVLGLTASTPCRAQSRYSITDTGLLPGTSVGYTFSGGINRNDDIVGYDDNTEYVDDAAFIWTHKHHLQSLVGLPGATETVAYGLNDLNQSVGLSGADYPSAHAVRWGADGSITDLGTLSDDPSSLAFAINNRSVAVGFSGDDTTYMGSAVAWYKGFIIELPVPSWSLFNSALSINDHNQIVGLISADNINVHSVMWDTDGSMTDLGTLGGPLVLVSNINNHGQVAGCSDTADGQHHAYVWDKVNGLQDLGTLGGAWGDSWFINNKGVIVGDSTNANGDDHAFIIRNGVMTDLNTLISAKSGWVLVTATSINDNGHIIGYGAHNGAWHTFLLTPKP